MHVSIKMSEYSLEARNLYAQQLGRLQQYSHLSLHMAAQEFVKGSYALIPYLSLLEFILGGLAFL